MMTVAVSVRFEQVETDEPRRRASTLDQALCSRRCPAAARLVVSGALPPPALVPDEASIVRLIGIVLKKVDDQAVHHRRPSAASRWLHPASLSRRCPTSSPCGRAPVSQRPSPGRTGSFATARVGRSGGATRVRVGWAWNAGASVIYVAITDVTNRAWEAAVMASVTLVTRNVSLPAELDRCIRQRATAGGYAGAREAIRAPLRRQGQVGRRREVASVRKASTVSSGKP